MPLHVLRWSLALVLGAGGAGLLVSLAHAGHPGGLAVLGAAELGAAVLFVVPRTVRAGGVALLGVLGVAVVLHAVVGEAPPVSFVVYAAAIWVVVAGYGRQVVS